MQIKLQTLQLQNFLEGLYDRYKNPLLKIIHKYVGDSLVCEDLFHEVFIRIIKNAEKLYAFPEHKLEAYIFLIAKGVSIDYLRKLYRNAQIDVPDDSLLNFWLQQQGAQANNYDDFEKVNLTIMLKSLSAEEQILLVGKYYLNLSTNDLVLLVGGTSTAVRSKLHRAKKRVFSEWTQSGLKMEDFING